MSQLHPFDDIPSSPEPIELRDESAFEITVGIIAACVASMILWVVIIAGAYEILR